jgi:hypothetical protein
MTNQIAERPADLYFEDSGVKWLISAVASPFTSRRGKIDVMVCKESDWGFRAEDRKLYRGCLKLAAEDGSIIRDYEAVPSNITVDFLRDRGFVRA